MLAIDRADILADRYISARKRHFSIIWRQTLFALMLEAVGSTVLLGLGGWLVINRQLTLGQLVASELIVTLVLAALSKIGKYVEIFYDLQATLDKLGILDTLPPEPISGERLDDGGPLAVVAELPGSDGRLRRLELSPGERVAVNRPDILIFEGLNVLQAGHVGSTGSRSPAVILSDFFDFSIYLDAEESSIESWYVERFLLLQHLAFQQPKSYFHHYAKLSPEEAREVALQIWREVNQVNLRENILPTRERAHLVLRKQADHVIAEILLRQR